MLMENGWWFVEMNTNLVAVCRGNSKNPYQKKGSHLKISFQPLKTKGILKTDVQD